jgi:hypothetical protein
MFHHSHIEATRRLLADLPNLPDPHDADEVRMRAAHAFRQHLELAAENLIELLDEIDGDPDFENHPDHGEHTGIEPDADEEGSLGWTATLRQEGRHWRGALDWCPWHVDVEADDSDHEDEHDGCEPDVDDEPSLGACEIGTMSGRDFYGRWFFKDTGWDQTQWSSGGCSDREEEHDGREPGEDAEYSLGWTDAPLQEGQNWQGDLTRASDRELDEAENGLADAGAVEEACTPGGIFGMLEVLS